jgi:uncharacterized protein (TIGR02117 family)
MRLFARLLPAVGLFLLLALGLGGLLPRNAGWREPDSGILIGIDATPVHTELVLPVQAGGRDWRLILPPGSVPPGTTHLSFSWGDADFFRATPTWAQFDVRLALGALFASEGSLLHVYRLAGPHGRPIRLTPETYRRLADSLAAEIAPGAPIAGYGAQDIFLPSPGRYSILRTCNSWVADRLAAAGVRVGLWTPLPQTLIWRFEDPEQREI